MISTILYQLLELINHLLGIHDPVLGPVYLIRLSLPSGVSGCIPRDEKRYMRTIKLRLNVVIRKERHSFIPAIMQYIPKNIIKNINTKHTANAINSIKLFFMVSITIIYILLISIKNNLAAVLW